MYFLATSGEDGTQIRALTRDELEQALLEEHLTPLAGIPSNDKGYWMVAENSAVIIKGEVVVPLPREVVKRFHIP